MGNCFRLALNHALFLYETVGTFKSRTIFRNIVLDNQQRIAALDIRSEIAGINIGDAGDKGGPKKRKKAR